MRAPAARISRCSGSAAPSDQQQFRPSPSATALNLGIEPCRSLLPNGRVASATPFQAFPSKRIKLQSRRILSSMFPLRSKPMLRPHEKERCCGLLLDCECGTEVCLQGDKNEPCQRHLYQWLGVKLTRKHAYSPMCRTRARIKLTKKTATNVPSVARTHFQ